MGPYELSFQDRLEEDDARFASSHPGSPGSSEKALPLSSIIPAIADIFSYFGNRADTDRRLNQQRQWQLEDWNRQNEYNSPAAVMARLRSAGINPDIVAGGASSNAAMPAQGSVPSSSQSMSLGSISRIAELREQARLQNDLVKSEIALNQANASKTSAEAEDITNTSSPTNALKLAQKYLAEANAGLVNNQADTEYQRGLSIALENWAKGYQGFSQYGDDFDVVVNSKDAYGWLRPYVRQVNSILSSYEDKYELDSYDVRYMRQLFVDLVNHDQKQLQADIAKLESSEALIKALGDYPVLQFLDHYLELIGPSVPQLLFSLFRRHR